MSPYRTPGHVEVDDEEDAPVQKDPWAVEKFAIAAAVVAIAIIAGAVTANTYIDSRAPCREGKALGFNPCPAGARAEVRDNETWCRCPDAHGGK